ncbi:hypothetical protein [Burkholderia pseudomultivorans]|uniref:hypothetical protein n=1 Tax=Burkholderia pseudomultivorans TaxID=1207504 RepID=UPI0018C75010|nr:hypothetical protein [Burkholderia pseudomultivorans]
MAVQLADLPVSNKIDSVAAHSENSRGYFRHLDAKFFPVYVCASGFVAFSIRQPACTAAARLRGAGSAAARSCNSFMMGHLRFTAFLE